MCIRDRDAAKTVERLLSVFAFGEQQGIRRRIAKTLRYVVSQRLLPRSDGGRIAAVEILKAGARTHEYLEQADSPRQNLLQIMKEGRSEGMQHFDGEIEKLVRGGTVDVETALKPVSYTHLDVYKRQTIKCGSLLLASNWTKPDCCSTSRTSAKS